MNIKELREKFATKNGELNTLLAKGQEMTGEDFKTVNALNAEVGDLYLQIEAAENQTKSLADMREQQAKRDALMRQVGTPGSVPHAPVLTKSGEVEIKQDEKSVEVLFDGDGGMSQKQLETIRSRDYAMAFRTYLKEGELSGLDRMERKTLQEGSDSAGGFTVPEAILLRMLQRKATPTRLAGMVSRLTTGRDHLTMPKVVWNTDDLYSTGIRVTFTGEVPSSSTVHRVTDPVFGNFRIPVWTAMLSAPITNDLLEDTAFGLGDWLSEKFGETRDLLYDNMILNGTGVFQPDGILKNPSGTDEPTAVNCGNPLTADGLMAMAWSVPEQYEENIGWVMNKTNVAAYIATLKDADNRFIWGTGLQDSGLAVGGKRQVAGYDVTFSGFSPNRASDAYPAVLGDLKGYYLVERVGLSIQVLHETYAELNQKVLLGRLRFGGGVGEPWRLRVAKQAA